MSRTSANFAFSGPVMSANFPGELIFGLPGEAGGYYSICVSQPDNETMRLTFQPSKNTMHPIDPVDIALPQGPKGDAGQADEAQVRALVQEYLAQNPPTVTESDPTVPQWAKAEEKPGYTAAEVGAVSTDALPDAIDEALAQAKESGEFDGITPEFTIGTVETLDAGSNATASISGTKENPVLNLGIPQGLPGEGGAGGNSLQWDTLLDVTLTEAVQKISLDTNTIDDFHKYNLLLISGHISKQENLTAPAATVMTVFGSEVIRDNLVPNPEQAARFGLFSVLLAIGDPEIVTGSMARITAIWNSGAICGDNRNALIELYTWGTTYLNPGTRMTIKAI